MRIRITVLAIVTLSCNAVYAQSSAQEPKGADQRQVAPVFRSHHDLFVGESDCTISVKAAHTILSHRHPHPKPGDKDKIQK